MFFCVKNNVLRFRSITRTYYRNSVGALVVFDVCNKKSLEHVPMWIMEAKRHIEPHKAVFILVGTKVSGEGRESKFGEARTDTREMGVCLLARWVG